jgi:1,4-dihydroxy-6-naphthoate synthase
MKLSLGFSPCPNDTFIFDAMVHHKVDTEGLEFELCMTDVEELNRKAFNNELDFSKVSFHAYLFLTEKYILLDSGSALGFGAGPLLISRRLILKDEFSSLRVAIPGQYTTANLLFSLAYPECINKTELLFSEIEQSVLDEKVDAGVIIHENRFTYQDKGLILINDLGDFWEKLSGGPIPLGGIVASNSLPEDVIARFSRVLRKSIDYAFESKEISGFVRCNAQEMSVEVMRKHIELYVNAFTRSLGFTGRTAVEKLFEIALEKGVIASSPQQIFF